MPHGQANFARVLADLYGQEDAQRVAADAGLPIVAIDFEQSAINLWSDIVWLAEKQDKLGDLAFVALRDYPTNHALRNTITDMLQLRLMMHPPDPAGERPKKPEDLWADLWERQVKTQEQLYRIWLWLILLGILTGIPALTAITLSIILMIKVF